MSDAPAERSAALRYEALAHRRRRRCLQSLSSHSSPVSVRRLASELAPADGDDEQSEARERVLASLVHRHLPKLAEAALVDWDRDAGTVALPDDLSVADSRLRRLLDLDGARWDDVFSALSSERRRVVVDVLEETETPLSGRELARRVAARERATSPAAVGDETVRSVRISLHHVHLPKLEGIDAVEREDGSVVYNGHPAFDADLGIAAADDGRAASPGDLGRAD